MPQAKPQVQAKAQAKTKDVRLPVFSFVPYGIMRDAVELLASALPGAIILFLFMVGVGIPTILTNSNWFAAPYIPVTCLLPLVVGMVSPLVLEWARATSLVSLRRGIACSLLSGLIGSILSVIVLFATSAISGLFNMFGPSASGLLPQLVLSVAIIALSTALSTVGGAVLVLFIQRAPSKGDPSGNSG